MRIMYGFMFTYLIIAVGSAIGGITRYWCTANIANYFGDGFPCGTIFVNLVGSFFIGLFYGLCIEGKLDSSHLQKFFMIGVCGGYTTFSSFSLDTLKLLEKNELFKAVINILISIIICLIFVYLGFNIAKYEE